MLQRNSRFLALLIVGVVLLTTGCENLFNSDSEDSSTSPSGFDTLGRGYDVTRAYANPSDVKDSRILDLEALEADGLLNQRTIDQGETEVISGESLEKYRTALSTSVSVGGSYKAFSGSVSAGFSRNSFQRFGQQFATVRAEVRQDKLFIDGDYNAEDLTRYLTDRFKERINDPDTPPERIFRDYGTHVITSIFTGGRLEYNTTVQESLLSTSRSFGVVAEAAFGVKFLEVDATVEFDSSDEETSYNSHAETRVNVYPAGSSAIDIANAEDYRAWQQAVEESNDGLLAAFDPNGLIPAWEFAEEQSRREALIAGFEDWLRRAEESLGLPDYEQETMTVPFSSYGGWPLIGGDADMDIDGGPFSNDSVPVTAGVRLSVSDDDHLVVTLSFNIQEDGGDGTHYSGERTLSFPHTAAGTIVGLEGVNSCSLNATATGGDGRTGTFSAVCGLGTISWRADGDGDDQNYVGLGGTLQVPVLVRIEDREQL